MLSTRTPGRPKSTQRSHGIHSFLSATGEQPTLVAVASEPTRHAGDRSGQKRPVAPPKKHVAPRQATYEATDPKNHASWHRGHWWVATDLSLAASHRKIPKCASVTVLLFLRRTCVVVCPFWRLVAPTSTTFVRCRQRRRTAAAATSASKQTRRWDDSCVNEYDGPCAVLYPAARDRRLVLRLSITKKACSDANQ